MGPTTYLLESPLPEGDPVISIATGFVRETFRRNRIDSRGSSVAGNMILVGNHFGLKVIDNHLLGGNAFQITAAPTESPVHWGWSHAPLMEATIAGNILEDSLRGGIVSVEHSPRIKTNKGRVYASAIVKDNRAVTSEAFAARHADKAASRRAAITIGDPAGTLDPAEMAVTESGNLAEGRAPVTLRVVGAKINGKVASQQVTVLPKAAESRK